MVTSLLCARPVLESGSDLIVAYGDIIYEPRVVDSLLAMPGDIVTVVDCNWLALWRVRSADPLSDAESLQLDGGNRIVDIGRKVRSLEEIEAQYIGLTRFTAKGIEQLLRFYDHIASDANWLMDRNRETCYMTDLLRGMIEAGHTITGAFTHGGWLEFDTIEDFTVYNRLLNQGGLEPYFRAWHCNRSW
jgi:choline kinase